VNLEPGPRILAILGPTASGKTGIALEVARRLRGEIISADSRQAYRGLEVGTAAPSRTDREGVPHHGVAFLEPGERYGAGRFARHARRWIRQIEARGAVPIVTGGTGLFVRALIDPVFREPDMDAERRRRLQNWLSGRSLPDVRRWAKRLDPGLAVKLAVLDRQRAHRSLELALLTGRGLTWWQRHGTPEADPVRARMWVLELGPKEHRERIAARTRRLLESGWLEEVEALASAGHDPESPVMNAIGYRIVWGLWRGDVSRDAAEQAILRDTWSYARRQRTWLRHQLPPDARRIDATKPSGEIIDRIVSEWSSDR
jgi:tRNA dimethylallyltransferase